MSILIGHTAKALIQGIMNDKDGLFSRHLINNGLSVVGVISPGSGGEWVLEGKIPVFDSFRSAVEATGADVGIIATRPHKTAEVLFEAIDLKMKLIVCLSGGIPLNEMVRIKQALIGSGTRLIGPGSPGIYSPGEIMLGNMPEIQVLKGHIGVISRSGPLAYKLLKKLGKEGLGISTFIGIGIDPVVGMDFADILPFYENDPNTEKMVILGRDCGNFEKKAADYLNRHFSKPVIALLAGNSAPAIPSSGYAGEVFFERQKDYESNVALFRDAGVEIVFQIEDIPEKLKQ